MHHFRKKYLHPSLHKITRTTTKMSEQFPLGVIGSTCTDNLILVLNVPVLL